MGVLETTPRGVSIQIARAPRWHAGCVGRKDGARLIAQAVLASASRVPRSPEYRWGGRARAAQSPWQRQMEHPCVCQCFEEWPWEFPRCFDLLGVGADRGG